MLNHASSRLGIPDESALKAVGISACRKTNIQRLGAASGVSPATGFTRCGAELGIRDERDRIETEQRCFAEVDAYAATIEPGGLARPL
jgi:hypothetical protein